MPYFAPPAAFLSAGLALQATLLLVTVLIVLLVASLLHRPGPDEPNSLPGYSLLHIVPFFRKRYDFLSWGFHAAAANVFQFNLLRNQVVVVSGEDARQTFFTAKNLDLTEGFKILSGAIPMVRGVTSDLQTKRIALIHKRLANVQRNASLSSLIPHLLTDTRRVMETWGTSGKFDPFEKVYELTFQLTIRSLTSTEIADKPAMVSRLKALYDTLDVGTTPATVLLPWLPTPAMIKKLWATKQIYEIVVAAIDARKASGVIRDDTLQMLLDTGDEKLVVVGFIMGLLIAGARATGTTASWLITYLGGHPDWRTKAAAEVKNLLAAHSPNTFRSDTSTHSLTERLSAIPLEAWERGMPVLDALIRETTRVAQPHTAMRRNLGPEMYINGKLIPTGAYVIYPFSDVHLDSDLYPDPWKFDPGRKEVTHVPFGYVGWGGGKTTCLGTRLAKVELKLITAVFVLAFEHSVIDPLGEPANLLPLPNWNDILLARPPVGSFNLGYERTDVPL